MASTHITPNNRFKDVHVVAKGWILDNHDAGTAMIGVHPVCKTVVYQGRERALYFQVKLVCSILFQMSCVVFSLSACHLANEVFALFQLFFFEPFFLFFWICFQKKTNMNNCVCYDGSEKNF